MLVLGVYALPLALVALVYAYRVRRQEALSKAQLRAAVDSGMIEPPSLHPVVDEVRCIGCGSCVSACPEGRILGLIGGKAVLVNPSECIGHGACRASCPEDAITLVFGSRTRGVDLPVLTPQFETSVPGIYVAGELGGMGLIRNAIEQGCQAMNQIHQHLLTGPSAREWDCVVVGCGPAGLCATLQARQLGLRAMAIDRSRIGGTVAHFPRNKLVMTSPSSLPGVGPFHFREVRKEELLGFWRRVVQQQSPCIHEHETLTGIASLSGGGFEVQTDRGSYQARAVLLALGRRGTPRTLGVAGEDLSKVVYELEDAGQFAGRDVLVVGGGDSALEAAAGIALASPRSVTLAYRGKQFTRAKRENRVRTDELHKNDRLDIRFESEVVEIGETMVRLREREKIVELPNDDVIVCAGGVLPTGLMRELGIEIETHYGEVR